MKHDLIQSLYPHTGSRRNSSIPSRGIEQFEEVVYVHHMESWDALRRNLTALMEAAQDGLISGPPGVLQLEAVTDTGKSTLYRILDPREKNPTQLDTLERIARAYNLQVWQLLVPRLDPLDPPAVIGSQRMNVLKSVFAQTTANATHAEQPEAPAAADRQTGGSTRDPDHRARPSGRTDTTGAHATTAPLPRRATRRGPKPKQR